jgi:tRNA A-37 threonylcarbamoyl transferase component Bud32
MPTESGQPTEHKPAPPSIEELVVAFPHLQIIEMIGQGGMGFVFKARQPKLERFVALKILPQTLALDPAFAERFQREARVLAKLNHPNIVTIFDFGQAGGFFFLQMEFVDGVNLRQAMKLGRFTPAQALDIVPKICDALHFAHNEGILHRDIKPENILLDSRGRVKIADFGIAKILGTESATETKVVAPQQQHVTGVVGTPNYMAPEQLATPNTVDQRADIYSLGVVFYEMLTGELPSGSVIPPSKKSTVDPRFDDVVLRTLEKERERRQRSADEVRTQVETIAESPKGSGSEHAWPKGEYNFRSKETIMGLPLVHVTWGVDPVTKRLNTAKGVVAVGPRAVGLIAVGLEAYGLFPGGLLAVGLAPVGLMALGGAAVGLLAGGLQGTGLFVAAPQTTGLFTFHSFGVFLLMVVAAFIFRKVIRTTIVNAFSALEPAGASAKVPPRVPASPVSSKDRFWRKFAIAIAAIIAIPILIGIIAITAAVVYPALSHAKHGGRSTLTAPHAPTPPRAGEKIPKQGRVFGEAHEQTIQSYETKAGCFLDIDSNKLLTPSAEIVEAIEKNPKYGTPERTWETRDIEGDGVRAFRYVQWIRETGADFLYMGDGRIVAFDCLLTPAHGNSSTNWEDINSVSPEEWRKAIATIQWGVAEREAQRLHKPAPPGPKEGGIYGSAAVLDSTTPNGPRVNELTSQQSRLWHFKTKRGAEGILEIVDTTNNPSSAKIRYRFLEAPKRTSSIDSEWPARKTISFSVDAERPIDPQATNSTWSVSTHDAFIEGEHLVTLLYMPDGSLRTQKATVSTNSAGIVQHTLTWTVNNRDAELTAQDVHLPIGQLRDAITQHPMHLVAGEWTRAFSVTNSQGGVITGYIEFHRHFVQAIGDLASSKADHK